MTDKEIAKLDKLVGKLERALMGDDVNYVIAIKKRDDKGMLYCVSGFNNESMNIINGLIRQAILTVANDPSEEDLTEVAQKFKNIFCKTIDEAAEEGRRLREKRNSKSAGCRVDGVFHGGSDIRVLCVRHHT